VTIWGWLDSQDKQKVMGQRVGRFIGWQDGAAARLAWGITTIVFRRLLMFCPIVIEGLHNSDSRFGTSSRSWITQHEQHLAGLRIEKEN